MAGRCRATSGSGRRWSPSRPGTAGSASTPTLSPEFVSTPGQLAFTPDGSKLIVTTKANGDDIDVFSVNRLGGPSAAPVVNADPGNVPFGVTFDPGGHLVVAETGINAVATFTVSRNGTLTLVARAATGQAATCWVAGHGALFYASNAGSGTISGFRDDGVGALQSLGTTVTDAGTVDATFSPGAHRLYVETGIAGVVDEYQRGGERRADRDRLGHGSRRHRRRGHRRLLARPPPKPASRAGDALAEGVSRVRSGERMLIFPGRQAGSYPGLAPGGDDGYPLPLMD